MKQELKNIIKELRELINESNLHLTDSELMDYALRIYNTNEINKFKNIQKPYTRPKDSINPIPKNEDEPTKSQIWKLKNLNITIPAGLTKNEASKLIKENLK